MKIENKSFLLQVEDYANNPIFGLDNPSFYCENNPFLRPSRPQDVANIDFLTPLSSKQYASNANLFAQRLLFNIYEQDLVFLPVNGPLDQKYFDLFYDRKSMQKGGEIKNGIEDYIFGFLEKDIGITGKWTLADFEFYTQKKIQDIATGEFALLKNILTSKDPKSAIRFFLIQCAGDFLSESSAMGRNVLGNFGAHTSELFKIFIDEYGYGVYEKKHSSLFEKLLIDAQLNSQIHYYWQFYTPSSLALVNYFHFISKNHCYFFRYLGALYFAEATLAYITKNQSQLIKEVFKGEVSALYFDEHSHIDVHHGRMAYEELIVPIIKQHGEVWLKEILIGFESFALLQDIADDELYHHIQVHDELENLKNKAQLMGPNTKTYQFSEKKGEVSTTHIHDVCELFEVLKGEIELRFSPDKAINLTAGEKMIIPKGILHGSVVLSEECVYQVSALEERKNGNG